MPQTPGIGNPITVFNVAQVLTDLHGTSTTEDEDIVVVGNKTLRSITALAAAMAESRVTVQVKPDATPCYQPDSNTIVLNALPNDNYPAETLQQLRAFFVHEIAEAKWRTMPPDKNLPKEEYDKQFELLNGLGDAWLDNKLWDTYPGGASFVRSSVRADAQKFIPEFNEAVAQGYEPDYTAFACLLRYMGENVLSFDEAYAKLPALQSVFDKLEHELRNLQVNGTEQEMYDQVMRMYPLLDLAFQKQQQQPQGPGGEEGEAGQGGEPEEGGGGGSKEEDEKGEGEGEGKPDKPDSDDSGGEQNKPKPKQQMKSSSERIADDLQQSLEKASNDQMSGFVICDTDIITTREGEKNVAADIKSYVTPLREALTTQLRRAVTVQKPMYRRRQMKGRIDPRRLAQFCGNREDVFHRKLQHEEVDTAVLISVDLSGSMGDCAGFLQVSAAAWTEACERIGVKTCVRGWSTGGFAPQGYFEKRQKLTNFSSGAGDPQCFDVLAKNWDESAKDGRWKGLIPRGGTPLVQGFYKGSQVIGARRERRRIMLLITDGEGNVFKDQRLDNKWMLAKSIEMRDAGIQFYPVALTSEALGNCRRIWGNEFEILDCRLHPGNLKHAISQMNTAANGKLSWRQAEMEVINQGVGLRNVYNKLVEDLRKISREGVKR